MIVPRLTRVVPVRAQKLEVPLLYLANASAMAVYASGRTDGLVLDCGERSCRAVPVVEGVAVDHAARYLDLGGHHVTVLMRNSILKVGVVSTKLASALR